MYLNEKLTPNEAERYRRQLLLETDYSFSQRRLKESTVFIAGAGGLGSPAALYLAAAGTGRIILNDCDSVELSNLNRQLLHSTPDIGKRKVESAKKRLTELNPDIEIEIIADRIEGEGFDAAAGADLVIDCLDNIEARWVINDFSVRTGIPIVHGGINGFAGQISFIEPPETACLRCIFSENLEQDSPIPVIGAIAGIIGSMQALEAVKYLSGCGELLRNKLMIIDGFSWETAVMELEPNESCPACGGGS